MELAADATVQPRVRINHRAIVMPPKQKRFFKMLDSALQPKGQLILRTLAMPADTNPAGDIFGGWIMSQMDIAGGILARESTCSRIVTVAVDSFKFIKPVHVGDVVCCYGEVVRTGTTSIAIHLEVWAKPSVDQPGAVAVEFQVTSATFTYVAVDSKGRKQVIEQGCHC
jgi:acyl-CoA thioesterase YciA